MAREWQAFGGSPVAHIIDTEAPHPKRSGPRSLCKRYPGRNYRPWWSMPVEAVANGPLSYELKRCPDCLEAS